MNYEKVPVEEWVAYLTKIITGKASVLLTTQLTPDILASYHKTRDALLDSVGLSYHHYAELFFHPSKSWDATPKSVHHGTVSAFTVILRGVKSLDDAKWIITRPGTDPGNLKWGLLTSVVTPTFRPHPW